LKNSNSFNTARNNWKSVWFTV